MLAVQPYASTHIFIFLDRSPNESDKARQLASRVVVGMFGRLIKEGIFSIRLGCKERNNSIAVVE
jgi:hypothetical protein